MTWRLHDRTRRRVCRAAFLIGCLAPALAVGGWCAARHSPGRVAAEARLLAAELGLSVKLGGLSYPRPGAVLYEAVELADPETNQPILRCRLLEVVVHPSSPSDAQTVGWASSPSPAQTVGWASSPSDAQTVGWASSPSDAQTVGWASSPSDAQLADAASAPPPAAKAPPPPLKPRPVVTLVASQPELEAAAMGKAWQWLEEVFRQKLGRLDADVRFSAAALTLHAADGSQTLTGVEGSWDNPAGQADVLLRFRLVGAETPEPARLRISRNRQVSPPATAIELYTGDGELPCRLLAMGLGDLRSLGPRCRFRGYVWADETPDGWEGELTGQLVELDLGRLISDHFPHRMSGVGQATVQSARFGRGRLEELNATLVAGPGAIDRPLVVAALDCLGLAPGAEPMVGLACRTVGLACRTVGPVCRTVGPVCRTGPESAASVGPVCRAGPEDAALRAELSPQPPLPEQIAYQQLAVAAALDAGGLRLRGLCAAGGPGTILSDGRMALFKRVAASAAPGSRRWLRCLFPPARCRFRPAGRPIGCCVTSPSPTPWPPPTRSPPPTSASATPGGAENIAAITGGTPPRVAKPLDDSGRGRRDRGRRQRRARSARAAGRRCAWSRATQDGILLESAAEFGSNPPPTRDSCTTGKTKGPLLILPKRGRNK